MAHFGMNRCFTQFHGWMMGRQSMARSPRKVITAARTFQLSSILPTRAFRSLFILFSLSYIACQESCFIARCTRVRCALFQLSVRETFTLVTTYSRGRQHDARGSRPVLPRPLPLGLSTAPQEASLCIQLRSRRQSFLPDDD